MQLRNGKHVLDAYRPTFDPNLDIATVVFSHVLCVRTRVNLAVVSKLWRDASKPAAAYPLHFDFSTPPPVSYGSRTPLAIAMVDNDEALSLPYDRVVGLIGIASEYVCSCAASRGCVRLLKWARENNYAWGTSTCSYAALYGQLPALQYLHENGCPWSSYECEQAAEKKHWDCLQYLVDNKAPRWEIYAKRHAEHLR
jgi:hypothetical protein